jgi:hypothetical protein
MLIQLINLVIFHYRVVILGVFKQKIDEIVTGHLPGFTLDRRVKDIKEIEPFHLWLSVISPKEKGDLVAFLKENIFQVQNRLLQKYRSGNTSVVSELRDLNARVKQKIPQGYWAVLYGRMQIYHKLRKTQPEKFPKQPKKAVLTQLPYKDFLAAAYKDGKLSLLAEECTYSILLGLVKRSSEITELTEKLRFNRDQVKLFYYEEELKGSLIYTTLELKEQEKKLSDIEKLFLTGIRSRTMIHGPGRLID